MSSSDGSPPPIPESSEPASGSNSTPSNPPPGTPPTTPNNLADLTTTPAGLPPPTSEPLETLPGTPNSNPPRASSAEAIPLTPDDEARQASKKRRSAASMAVENEKSSRTEALKNAPPLLPKNLTTRARPGTFLRRADARSRRAVDRTGSPSVAGPSRSAGPSQNVALSGPLPAPVQYGQPSTQANYPLAQAGFHFPLQSMQGVLLQPLQQAQQLAQQPFALPLQQNQPQQFPPVSFQPNPPPHLVPMPLQQMQQQQQLQQQFAQMPQQNQQQFAQMPQQNQQQFAQIPQQNQPQQLAPISFQQNQPQQLAPMPLQQMQLQFMPPPSSQDQQLQQFAPPPPPEQPEQPERPERPVVRDPRRRRGRRRVQIEEDDIMGELEEEWTSGMEDTLSSKSPSEIEQEAYDGGEEEEEGEEMEDEFDDDLDRYLESTYSADDTEHAGRPRRDAAGADPRRDDGRSKTSLGDGELTYYIVDQLNDIRVENRVHNDALMNRMDKIDNRIASIEAGGASLPLQVKRRLKTSRRAPKPSRSKQSRIELPPPTDGKPRTAVQIEALMAVELEYLNRAQKVVRIHFLKLLRVKSFEKMAEKCPPLADSEIATYNKFPNDQEYFAPNNYRVDFSRSWATFSFNIDARDYFIRHLQHALGGGAYRQDKFFFPERYRTEFHLGAALDTHMEHCRARIRKIHNPLSSDAEEEEKRKARARARRGTLHAIRVGVVVDCEYDEHLDLMTKLTAVNHSEDETDVDMPRKRTRANRFRIIRCDWMSDELRGFLRGLYEQYVDDWETSPTRRQAGGSAPRERVTTTPPMSELGRPAVGLWRNCYNDAWLGTLKRHELRNMCIVEGNYDFTIRPRPTQ